MKPTNSILARSSAVLLACACVACSKPESTESMAKAPAASASQEPAQNGSAQSGSAPKESAQNGSAPKESAQNGMAPRESAQNGMAPKESARNASASKDAVPADAAKHDAAAQDTAAAPGHPSSTAKDAPTSAAGGKVDELLARGRAALAAGRTAEAQAAFDEAEALDGGTLRTRLWTLRGWLAAGRVNDTLNAIDALDRAGSKGPEMDYLYGMAFAHQARARLREGGIATNTVGMAFSDAYSFLSSATKADATRFADAFPFLAEAAYQSSKFDDARRAIDTALASGTGTPETWAMKGKIAFQQYVAAASDDATKDKSGIFLDDSMAANQKVLALLDARAATPGADDRALRLAAHLDLGMAHAWRRQAGPVADEFAAAIAIDPNGVDMMTLRALVDGEAFLPAIEKGIAGWQAAGGTDANTLATLEWWKGRAQYEARKYADSEATFLAVLAKTQFYNSWWYVALARYQMQKHDAAVEALRKNWEVDPTNLVASINGNREYGLSILDGLIAQCVNKQKNLDAAFLSEVETAVAPDWAPYWNNLGLFYRDAGDGIARSKKAKDDEKLQAQAKELWEKSLVAYEKALALSPEDPNYLNDLAVILHYNLRRDLERAKALYEKAAKRAAEELARKDLSVADRGYREIAARDSKNNLALLEKELAKAAGQDGAGQEPPK